jgi:hypothetical protein
MRCRGVHGIANAAYLVGFLCSGLLRVAPYCVPGGITLVSGRGLALTLAALELAIAVDAGISSAAVQSEITGMSLTCSVH